MAKPRKRFDINFLQECMTKSDATLTGSYEKLNRDSVITFVCSCGEEGSKPFRNIIEKAVCKKCTKAIGTEKRIKTTGYTNVSQRPDVREKIKQTWQDKYNGHPLKSQEIKDKVQQTFLEKYGCHATQSPEVKEKIKQTHLERLGVANPSLSPEVQEKRKETMMERHGVTYPFESKEIRAKAEATFIKRYNCSNPMQCEEIKAKATRIRKKEATV